MAWFPVAQKLNPFGAERSKIRVKEPLFMKILTLTLFLCLCFSTTFLSAETLEIDRFELENPLGPAQFTELGRGAFSATWPEDKPYEEASVELIVVNLGPSAVKTMSDGGGSVYDVILVTFLGIFEEPEEINKTLFLGATSARKVYASSVPREHKANIFSKTLGDGSFVLVGVRIFEPNEGGGELVQSIANTFKRKVQE